MKNKEIENGLEGIGILENEMSKLEAKIDEMVTTIVQKDFPEIEAVDIDCPFILECEKSPFGWCVYDVNTEPAMPCLYCDKPYERN